MIIFLSPPHSGLSSNLDPRLDGIPFVILYTLFCDILLLKLKKITSTTVRRNACTVCPHTLFKRLFIQIHTYNKLHTHIYSHNSLNTSVQDQNVIVFSIIQQELVISVLVAYARPFWGVFNF